MQTNHRATAGNDPTGPLKIRSAAGSLAAVPALGPIGQSAADESGQSRSIGAVVASATVIASEVLADFLNSLAEPPIPTQLKALALQAASLLDTDALLALPMQLDQAVGTLAQYTACYAISFQWTDANAIVALLGAVRTAPCLVETAALWCFLRDHRRCVPNVPVPFYIMPTVISLSSDEPCCVCDRDDRVSQWPRQYCRLLRKRIRISHQRHHCHL